MSCLNGRVFIRWRTLQKVNLTPGWRRSHFNSLVAGKLERNFGYVTFKRILVIASWGISCEIALTWMSLDFIDDQSTLVQVMVITSANFDLHPCRHMTSLGHNISMWMAQSTFDDTSTLIRVMAWSRRATSHYLSQFWPTSMSLTMPQCHRSYLCKKVLWNGDLPCALCFLYQCPYKLDVTIRKYVEESLHVIRHLQLVRTVIWLDE